MATFKIKKDVKGEYYWILRSNKNYEVIAKSSESYINKTDAKYSINWTKANAPTALVKDETLG